jgi:tetratricopeptide (TPR) repeat protein
MKRIFLIIGIIVSVLSIGALIYFSIIHRSLADYLNEAETAFNSEDYSKAERILKKVIRKDPTSETAYRLLAKIAEQKKNFAAAAYFWKNAALLDPLDNELVEKQAFALINCGNMKEAAKILAPRFQDKSLTTLGVLLYAESLTGSGKLEQASRIVDSVLNSNPGDARAELLKANIYFQKKNIKQALPIYKKLSNSKDPKIQIGALVGIGNCLKVTNKNNQAGTYFFKAEKIAPDSAGVANVIANYYYSQGDFTKAIPHFKQVLQNKPFNIPVALKLAECYTAQNKIPLLRKMQKKYSSGNKAIVSTGYYLEAMIAYLEKDSKKTLEYLKLSKIFRERPVYNLIQLQSHASLDDLYAVRLDIDKMLKSPLSAAAREQIIAILAPMVKEQLKLKKFENAIALSEIIRKVQPDSILAMRIKMNAYFKSENFFKAEMAATEILKKNPDIPDALEIRGWSLIELNFPKESIKYFKKLQQVSPKSTAAFLGLAKAYSKSDNISEASNTLKTAAQKFPENPTVINSAFAFFLIHKNYAAIDTIVMRMKKSTNKAIKAAAFSLAAEAATQQKLYSKAIDNYRKALEINQGQAELYINLADLLKFTGKSSEAQNILNKGQKLFPENPHILFRIAYMAAEDNKNLQLAEKIYRQLADKYPKWALVLVNLSEVMAEQNKPELAMQYAVKAKLAAPDWLDAWLCYAMRKLQAKEYGEASEQFEYILKKQPDNEAAREGLIQCLTQHGAKLYDKGDFPQAESKFKRLKELNPESKDAVKWLKLISEKQKARKPENQKNEK